jgi:hypothetical protein
MSLSSLQTILDQIKRTGYQCWIHIYSSLFWIISVHIDQWKLRRNQRDTLSTINNVFTTTLIEESLHPNQRADADKQPTSKLKCRQKKIKRTKRTLSQSPIQRTSTQFISKEPPKKPSFLKSWKRQTQTEEQSPLLQTNTTADHAKRTFFLRRLSASNTSIHSTDSSGSSSSSSLESPKSILKSFSFKLKRQSSFTVAEQPRRLSLASFRRKNST